MLQSIYEGKCTLILTGSESDHFDNKSGKFFKTFLQKSPIRLLLHRSGTWYHISLENLENAVIFLQQSNYEHLKMANYVSWVI
jgi:hypothetical protein